MSALLRVLPNSRMKPKPAAPTNSQLLPCGEGRRGRITQVRTVTWNVDTQLWEVGDWNYQSDNCVTITKPAGTENRNDCPAGYSGYRTYARSVTWNPTTEDWVVGAWGVQADYCSYVPPPASTQTISCPTGYVGSGQVQQRSVTWDFGSQSWVVGGWSTVQFNCVIQNLRFVTPVANFNPRLSGKYPEEGLSQVYGPYSVTDQQGVGRVMTLRLYVVVENNIRWSYLNIDIPGATGTVTVYWDRDYSYFPPQTLVNGSTAWKVRNSEWTQNATYLMVDLVS